MSTRRQEKVARVIKEVVSEAITHHLNDPRIVGFVSVTHVEVSADLRCGDVYLSIFGKSETEQKTTFEGIKHARSRIQSIVGQKLSSKFCPVLRFHLDEKFKKTLEIMTMIDEAAKELKDKDSTGPKE